MSKLEALHAIIEQISGHDDHERIESICKIVISSEYCFGINCDNCPFNGPKEMGEAAIELTPVNKLEE